MRDVSLARMLLAEDLLLLAYDDDTVYRIGAGNLEYALTGAMLIELAERGRIDVIEEDGTAHLRLDVVDSTPTGSPLLDEWLAKIVRMDGTKPKDVVLELSGELADRLLAGLTDRGIVHRGEGQAPGIMPVARWSDEDSDHEQHLVRQMECVLVEGAQPDQRTGALISLLTAIDGVPTVAGADREQVATRAKKIAEGYWGSEATRKAVEEITAVVMLTVMVPTMAALSAS